MNESFATQRNKVMDDLRVLINDAEALLKSGSENLGDGANHWRTETQNRLQNLQLRLSDLQQNTAQKLRQAGQKTQTYVTENPWKAISIASAVALLTGYLINRR
jgi:ElaB/YqjD/DUF883 family membrane-anchored ribosome-binding protein